MKWIIPSDRYYAKEIRSYLLRNSQWNDQEMEMKTVIMFNNDIRIIEVSLNTFMNTFKKCTKGIHSRSANKNWQLNWSWNKYFVFSPYIDKYREAEEDKAKLAAKTRPKKVEQKQVHEQIKLFIVFSICFYLVYERHHERKWWKKNYWIAKRLTAYYWKTWSNCHWPNFHCRLSIFFPSMRLLSCCGRFLKSIYRQYNNL